MNTRFIKAKKVLAYFSTFVVLVGTFVICMSMVSNFASAKSQTQGLSETQLNEFAQNNILFYDPGECIASGNFSGVCGSNTKEKLWSVLRQFFDEVHTAAAIGNILHEGGLNPLRWEYKAVNNTNPPTFSDKIDDWNKLYDGTYMQECYDSGFTSWYCIGLGDFAITSGLDKYLQYIKKNEPDLFEYFKSPEYTYVEGDELIDKLGESIYDRLIALEVKYFVEEWLDSARKEEFEGYTDVVGAARYYSRAIMACDVCKTDSEMASRAASATKIYDEMKNFTCTASSSSSNSGSSGKVFDGQITWIGDSNSTTAGKELIEDTFPNVDYGPSFDNPSSYVQACKFVDSIGCGDQPNLSGLEILRQIIKRGELRPYLVFALGDNGGWDQGMLDKLMGMVGNDTKVILTTSELYCSYHKNYYDNDCTASNKMDYSVGNALLKKTAQEYGNVYVADVAANYKDEYFDPNDTTIEFNSDGAKMFVQTIADTLNSIGSDDCLGESANPIVTVDGTEYMFPLAGASKDNYLHDSILSPMPCTEYSPGACHHNYVALDLGLRRQKVDGVEKTNADYPGLNYDDEDYYSDGVKVLAFVEGEVTYAGTYSKGVPDGYGDKCGQLMYKGIDGNEYWIGHLTYNDSIKAGDKFKLGDVIGEVGPPPCAQGTPSHVHIHISPDSSNNTKIYDIINAAYEALPQIRSSSTSSNCNNVCKDDGSVGVKGFSSAEDAQFILKEYLADDLSDYSLWLPHTNDYHDNCVAFSVWFVNHFTEVPFKIGGEDGDKLVDYFMDNFATDYPKLKVTYKPSVYSIASWSVCSPGWCSHQHTGIVIGIDEANNKILVAEAGADDPSALGVHEWNLNEASGTPESGWKYVNLNDYLKPNMGLK